MRSAFGKSGFTRGVVQRLPAVDTVQIARVDGKWFSWAITGLSCEANNLLVVRPRLIDSNDAQDRMTPVFEAAPRTIAWAASALDTIQIEWVGE